MTGTKTTTPFVLLRFARTVGVALLLATPLTATAQQAPAKISASATADQYADLATRSYKIGEYQTALQQFRNAYKAEARPLFLYNVGRCLEKLGRYGESSQHMRSYLQRYRQANRGQSAPNQDAVLNLIVSLREQQHRRRAKVVIGSNPPGATVTRVDDGRVLGVTPLKLQLKTGIYKLRLELDNHQAIDADLEVPETDKVRAVFTLKAIRERAAISVWVNIRGAKIELDGKAVAASPFNGRLQVRPGRHVVKVTKKGYEPHEEVVTVPQDQVMEISYVMLPVSSMTTWRSWVGWPTIAASLGSVGGGVAAGSTADRYYADSAAFDQLTTYEAVGYSLGAVGAAAGLGLVLWDAVRDPVEANLLVPGRPRVAGKRLKPLNVRAPR